MFMLWYGFTHIDKVHRYIKHWNRYRSRRNTLHSKPEIVPVTSYTLITLKQLTLTAEFDFIGLRNVNIVKSPILIYLYNKTYFVNLLLDLEFTKSGFEIQTTSFRFDAYTIFPQWLLYLRRFSVLISRFSTPCFIKLKFRGKGYYLYKNFRNVVTPQFGYSHRRYFYGYLASIIFLSKTKILVFGLSTLHIILFSHLLKTIRPANIFTGRGMRFAKQVVYKKVGKVSTYR